MADAQRVNEARVSDAVAALADLDLEGLRDVWRQRIGPPTRLRSPDLLRRLLAWDIQVEAYGGLDAATLKALRRPAPTRRRQPLAPAGSRITREWRGRYIEVDVVEGGFRWEGKTYASLSEIARAVTGVRWNGPRFFGLRGKKP